MIKQKAEITIEVYKEDGIFYAKTNVTEGDIPPAIINEALLAVARVPQAITSRSRGTVTPIAPF